MFQQITVFLRLIRFSHTVFALPFAIIGALLAAGGLPSASVCLWILVAMVAARTAGMGFNRFVDAEIDAENPRTQGREIPSGQIGKPAVAAFTLGSAALFVFAAARLNPVALVLSPVVLVVLCGYSYTKRFTPASHFVLGLALGLAPVGAWVAILGTESLPGIAIPITLGTAVLLWVAGFDILYACLDIDFDRKRGLHSVPRHLGVKRSLRLAAALHAGMVLLLVAVAFLAGAAPAFLLGIAAVAGLLIHEHRLVRPDDLSKMNQAFFTVNSIVGLLLLAAVVIDLVAFGRVP